MNDNQIRRRGVIRSMFIKTQNIIEELLKAPKRETDLINARFQVLEERRREILELDRQILDELFKEEKINTEFIQEEMEKAEQYTVKFYEIQGKLKTPQSVPYSMKIAGVLQELKDDIIKESQLNHMAGDYIHHTSDTPPKSGLADVYVEQNGRFTKAPKEIIEQDLNSGLRYLETVDSEESYNTPLDMAIYAQKMWNVLSKICFGILAGIAAYDLILIHFQLEITRNWTILEKFLDMYSPISFLITKCYHIILTICLITLFDWFDLAHMNLQHLADTFHFRKIWIVTVIYLAALFAALYNYSSDDLMILYDNIKEDIKDNENIDYTIYFWMVAKKICCWCCLIGWILMVLTNNEDLFLIHLMAMKKYDYDEGINQVYENVNAIP